MADSSEVHLISFHVPFALIINRHGCLVEQIITIRYMVLDNALIQRFTLMTTFHVPRLWQCSGRLIYRDCVCRNSWSRQCRICQGADGLAVFLPGEERHDFLKRHTDTAWTDAAKIGPEAWYILYVRAYHPELAWLGI
jgi:hypothetical protein